MPLNQENLIYICAMKSTKETAVVVFGKIYILHNMFWFLNNSIHKKIETRSRLEATKNRST
jgi:hypothetical protein